MDAAIIALIGLLFIEGLIIGIQYGNIRSLQNEATARRKEVLRLRDERDIATQEATTLALAAARSGPRQGVTKLPVRRYRNKLREAEEGRS